MVLETLLSVTVHIFRSFLEKIIFHHGGNSRGRELGCPEPPSREPLPASFAAPPPAVPPPAASTAPPPAASPPPPAASAARLPAASAAPPPAASPPPLEQRGPVVKISAALLPPRRRFRPSEIQVNTFSFPEK
ncbi:lysine-rich arabinogalactan protein 19-like [Magnolia sinica]|uniref:lysine-rich arabinogalactan protein 19-like n=1 Tax=Magnolia sinica TaxID=86752 RepID=UPI00265A6E19|nr:lysine-rich arabinogalactan protein 19-like [Magnolia sinica]